MTVSSTTNRNSYSCNGSQKEFPFNFKIFAKTDLVVILRDSEGSETTLTLTTDYTVSAGPWPTGGIVTTVKAYVEENTLVIIRELPQTQGADYVENDPFPAETHEEGLDRGVMILQELTEKIARMLILAKSSSYCDLRLPDPVASKLLAWKDDLSGIKNVEIKSQGDLAVTDYIKTLLDDEDAVAALITLGLTATKEEINSALDGITATAAEINTVCDPDNKFHSPMRIPASAFGPSTDTQDWEIDFFKIRNRAALTIQEYFAPVILPDGVTISKLTLYGFRDDALATMTLRLERVEESQSGNEMAEITADWTSGYSNGYDDTISYATIDNENYAYALRVQLTCNDAVNDVRFTSAKIEFTY